MGKWLRRKFGERPVGPLPPTTVHLELEGAPRWYLLDAGVERRRGLVELAVNQEVGGHLPVRGALIQARRQDGLDLRREQPAVLGAMHEEGLHPEPVPRPKEHATAPVVNDERPHAVQPGEAFRAPMAVGGEQDLSVAGRAEAVAGGAELVAQLDIVVDLAVEDDDKLAILRGHRLMAGGTQVEDGETAKPEAHLVIEVQARVIRASVRDALRHSGEGHRVRLSTGEAEHDDEATHSRGDSVRDFNARPRQMATVA